MMETIRINDDNIRLAAEIIKAGGLVAVPTETVYGLAANGLDEAAVRRIYDVKGRPEQKPLSLMVHGVNAMEMYWTYVPHAARALAGRFWPGPLTMVMTAKPGIPETVRAGGDTVALRCPDHPLTLELLKDCRLPLAAPSANPSGQCSARTPEQVSDYFDGRIEAIISGGECRLGIESTIIDFSVSPFRLLRRGAVTEEEINGALVDSLTIIGITGGSGSGKTTALESLESLGALVIDCDAVYHELTRSSEPMREELTQRFGQVYNGDKLDRKAIGRIVFDDSTALAELNAITHKYVNEEVDRRLLDWAKRGGRCAAVDAIALLESGIAPRCKTTVGITAPAEERVKRLVAREGITEEYARARISAQHDSEYFRANCGHVIENDGTYEQFREKCDALFNKLLKEE